MSNYTVIRLENFQGGLHLARGLSNNYDTSLETLHSDTIKSALFVCALQLYGEDKIGKSFLESFKISSAFPFYTPEKGGKVRYFFPKPEIPHLPFENIKEDINKKLKKVRFLEQELFELLIQDGNKKTIFNETSLKGKFLVKDGSNLKTKMPKDGIYQSEPYQHVYIPQDYNEDSQPYYVDKIYFHKKAGLFCLVEVEDISVLEQIKSAFRLLADNGIGTDRNIGNGQFDVTFDKMTLKVPKESNYELSLSLYCPYEEEIKEIDKSFYGLTKRGGYISSPQDNKHLSIRKRSIHMFTEGSVFFGKNERQGKIVNLQPDNKFLKGNEVEHPIWRDGRALFIPFNYNNQQ
jgi:CRISPR type III-A-associated RAMP protein Csm4